MPPIAPIIAAIRTWGLWPVLATKVGDAWRWLTADLWRLAAVIALLWGAMQWGQAKDWRQRATTAQDDLARAKASSIAAGAQAEDNRIKTEAASATHARNTDHAEPTPITDHRAAADRWAAANRLRPAQSCNLPSSPDKAGQDSATPHRDGPGPDAVVIPLAKYNELRDNTLRLERVRIWGEEEIEAGRAVKVDD